MRLRRVLSGLGAGLATTLLAGALPAEAVSDPFGYISALSVHYDVSADGVLRVTETIDYRVQPRGNLARYFDIREPYWANPKRDQVWEYSGFTATSPSGAPTDLWITELDPHEQGDDSSYDSREAELSVQFPRLDGPARTVRYVLSYEVRGALVQRGTGVELQGWSVATARPARIDRTDVRVTMPSGVRTLTCRSSADPPCTTRVTPDRVGQVKAGRLDDYGGLSISVEAPAGAVRGAGPILADPPGWLDKLGVGGVLAALLAVALLLVPAIPWAVARARRTGTRATAR